MFRAMLVSTYGPICIHVLRACVRMYACDFDGGNVHSIILQQNALFLHLLFSTQKRFTCPLAVFPKFTCKFFSPSFKRTQCIYVCMYVRMYIGTHFVFAMHFGIYVHIYVCVCVCVLWQSFSCGRFWLTQLIKMSFVGKIPLLAY